MARTSAWGPPAGAVWPRPTICPSRTTTAPTAGLGCVRPTARRASASASRIQPSAPAGSSGSVFEAPAGSPRGVCAVVIE